MTLRDILPKSIYCSGATIMGEESIDKVYGFIQHNMWFLSKFSKIVIAINWVEGVTLDIIHRYKEQWRYSFPNVFIIEHTYNRGHQFGSIDLDESLFKCVKEEKGYTYMWKSAEDMLIDEKIFDTVIEPNVEFLYLPGFSYESIQILDDIHAWHTHDNDRGIFIPYYKKEIPTPQTNFFIMDVSVFANVYGDTVEDKIAQYNKEKETNQSLKPWEMKTEDGIKFDCETLLGTGMEHCNTQCLISDETFYKLIQLVRAEKLGDPSHKNILFQENGLCHYHYHTSPVHII